MKNLSKIIALTLALTLTGTSISNAHTTTTIPELPSQSTQDLHREKRFEKTNGLGWYIYLTVHDQRHLLNGGFEDVLDWVMRGVHPSQRKLIRRTVERTEEFLRHNGTCEGDHRLEYSSRKRVAKCVDF